MILRKEQVVFIGAAAVLGLMAWGSAGSEQAKRGGTRAPDLELDRFGAPDVARAMESTDSRPDLSRELFSPPRDTRPLPPLEFREPPAQARGALRPPPAPTLSARHFARLLRTVAVPAEVPGLFAQELEELSSPGFGGDGLVARGDSDGEAANGDGGEGAGAGTRGLIRALGYLGGEEQEPEEDLETPEERAARIASYKQLHDWILINDFDLLFGSIENEDRYGLFDLSRGSDPILLTQIDPTTGEEAFPGQEAVSYERSRVTDLAFADTVANRIEVELRRIGGRITRGNYADVLAFADGCVRDRLEAPRALQVAEEVYGLLAAFDAEDPAPRLGLARCYEAGFLFGEAFDEYSSLLESFGHRSEVHVRLAQLEQKFMLFDRARARLEQAVAIDRSAFEPRWALGRMLLARGEGQAAVQQLEQANRYAPEDPDSLYLRVAARTDLGAAYLHAGRTEDAIEIYTQALRADPQNERAKAGLISARYLQAPAAPVAPGGDESIPEQPGEPEELLSEGEEAGFDLLLAEGLVLLDRRDFPAAVERLQAAALDDPLRANAAWRALSWLAELTGYPGEAMRLADQAVECDPTDAFARYQRGRLRAQGNDEESAAVDFERALEQELDFEDALVALGELAFRAGRYEDALRYLERAISIAPERSEFHAQQGFNLLNLDALVDARSAFERALQLDPDSAEALCGRAWCAYRLEDAQEGITLLADMDESRRDFPEQDPFRAWAREQIERIRDHTEKVLWGDRFERTRLRNSWIVEEGRGPLVSLLDGRLKLEGVHKEGGRTRVYREYPASLFVSLEASLYISQDSNVRAGLFIARERDRARVQETIAEASVSRHKDGSLQTHFKRSGENLPRDTDVEGIDFPLDRWVRLRIERSGESTGTTVDIWVDGIPVAESVPMGSLGRAASPLRVGLYVEGDTGRSALVQMDDVEVVFRQIQ